MKMKRLLLLALVAIGLSIPCYAIKSMMFNSIDQYMERANGVWIVELLSQGGEGRETGSVYEGRVLRSLKGEPQKGTLSFCAISRQLTVGRRYLVFGFNHASDAGAWLDNGNVSPVEIPPSLSLAELEGKAAKEQILSILTARCTQIVDDIRKLNEEKKALEDGIQFQDRLDKLPGKEK